MLARGGHNLAQQNGASGPTSGDQLVALCYGVIVAIAASRAQQLFFTGETVFISLGMDRRINDAIDVLKL